MKIKRFHAVDVRQAIQEVRAVLGKDAVILSNTRVDGGVEIVAATDYDEKHFQRPNTAPPEAKTKVEINPSPRPIIRNETAQLIATEQNITPVPSQDPALTQMRDEIASMKSMLQNQLSVLTWNDMAKNSPVQMQLLQHLLAMGLDLKLAKNIAQKYQQSNDFDSAWRQSLGTLANRIQVQDNHFLETGGIYSLIGPTGVGKTTTIAKLAARCALQYGAKNVALITADCFRIGAQEQLRTYARILGIPLRVVRTHTELAHSLNELLDRKFILIDTAGMSQKDIQLSEKFTLLKDQSPKVKNYLTLSTTSQTNVLNDTINAFSHLHLSGCILTKTDETNSLGGAISAIITHQLPLAYLCNGQKVPEDFSLAKPATLVKEASLLIEEQSLDAHTLPNYGGSAAYG
ncbi:MAG TPA: flagellar biosynthesis protein FlhF [Gammaproteobacteria bacterium]|nr:flagellar biosynthesis protein FlhF [Gammaproteobacteria bacterium]